MRREQVRVWGPAVWAPEIEDAPWGARVLTIADPFGNHLRFNEPDDPALKAGLPDGGLRSQLADSRSWTGRAPLDAGGPASAAGPPHLHGMRAHGSTAGVDQSPARRRPVAYTNGSSTFDAYAERPSGCRSEEGRR